MIQFGLDSVVLLLAVRQFARVSFEVVTPAPDRSPCIEDVEAAVAAAVEATGAVEGAEAAMGVGAEAEAATEAEEGAEAIEGAAEAAAAATNKGPPTR